MAKALSLCMLLAVCMLPSVLGHTYLSWISLDGSTPQEEGDCIRPHPARNKEYPILSVYDGHMTCSWLPEAAQPANRKCAVKAGDTLGMQWHHNANTPEDLIIADTHKGPISVYLAKSETGAGDVWFKIYEDGYDPVTRKWAVDRLLDSKGFLTFKLPTDIAPGNYLLRGEIFALHEGNILNGVQPYVGCAELTISGEGSAEPAGVAFPGYHKPEDPGLFFDIYSGFTSYPIPGPPLYTGGSSSPSTPSTSAPTSAPPNNTASTVTPTNKQPDTGATSAPVDETKPTSAPTTSSFVRVQLYPSSNEYWLAATVRSDPATTGIELKDSGEVNSWRSLQQTTWGYWMFPAANPVVLPISLRITSATGSVLELPNIFTSWTETTFIDTGKKYPEGGAATEGEGEGEEATEEEEEEPAEGEGEGEEEEETVVDEHTQEGEGEEEGACASEPEEGGEIKIRTHEGSSTWWVAVAISDAAKELASVEVKDSDTITEWAALTQQSWGYWTLNTKGSELAAPYTFKLTATDGQSVEIEVLSLVPNSLQDTAVQFE